MSTRWFVPHTARIGLQIGSWAASSLAFLKSVEARINSLDIMVSDVFGADAFVARRASPPTVPIAAPARNVGVRWDEGLDFCAEGVNAPNDSESVRETALVDLNSESHSNATDEEIRRDVPRFLILSRYLHRQDDDVAVPVKSTVRSRLLMLSCAFLLLIAWINAGQSGTLRRSQPSAADSIADRFSGYDDGTAVASTNTPHLTARLRFAPRFAIFYADFVPKEGVMGEIFAPRIEPAAAEPEVVDDEDLTFAHMRDASSVVIRNLPVGTELTPGERVSPTDWKLKSDELKSIVVKVPADRSGPIRATFEMLNQDGATLGKMAVEIREHQAAGKGNQRKTVAIAGGAIAPAKRRTIRTAAALVAPKAQAKGDGAKAPPANPATQQFYPQ